MIGSQAGGRTARGSVAVTAVVALVAALLAVVGLAAAPASAADAIAFRASAQAVVQPDDGPGDHPGHRARDRRHAAVRHEQQALASVTDRPRRLDARGHAALEHRHRDDPLQQGGRGQRRRNERRGHVLGDHQVDHTLLAYDGTAADPVAVVRLGGRDGQPGDPHDPRRHRRRLPAPTSSPTGPTSRPPTTDGLDAPGRPDPAQHRARHWRRPHHRRSRPTRTRRQASAPARASRRPAPPRRAKATMWTVVLQADQGGQPERGAGRVVHHQLPPGDLHRRRIGLHRHRARHDRVVRLGLR